MTDIRLEVNGVPIPAGLQSDGQDWRQIRVAAKFKKVGFIFGRQMRSLYQTKDLFFAKNPDISFFGGKATVSACPMGEFRGHSKQFPGMTDSDSSRHKDLPKPRTASG